MIKHSKSKFLLRLRNLIFGLLGSGLATAHASSWMLLSPATFPAPRSYVAMTYDPVSQKTVLFGGYDGRGYLKDTWTFDGSVWTRVKTPTAPPARANAQMAYDIPTQRVVLFGGYNGRQYLGDTWLWDGATLTWTQATPLHSPTAVTGPMLFTGPKGGVNEFGGFDGNRYQGTMWRWKGSDWIKLHPALVPYARSSAAVGLNPLLNQVVMFGGLADVNPVNTWTYDGTAWTMQSVSNQPPWVYAGSAAFDLNLKKVILFGGGSGGFGKVICCPGLRPSPSHHDLHDSRGCRTDECLLRRASALEELSGSGPPSVSRGHSAGHLAGLGDR